MIKTRKDLFGTLEKIEGWYKSAKTPEATMYRSHEVRHVEKDEYDTWTNQMVTSVKVDVAHKECKSHKSR